MRKIRGWILNLTDGLGPDPGTVEVAAKLNDTENLELEEHTLGYLNLTHQTGGSGSPTHADSTGHFGWDMEFSPGPITTRIVANDPEPPQNRARFPDESAQIGKAFHSDLERLGWAAGRDCLVWGAIEGAAQPTAATWATNPWQQGDWGVTFEGAAPGRVLLNRGIGFLGGVVFSVETPNYPLQVPVLGEDAAPANTSATEDRWDLLVAWMDVDPASATYGKQGISIQRGQTGGGIPPLDTVIGRRQLVIHALKMVAGASVYSDAFDLRPWQNAPALASPSMISKVYQHTGTQVINNALPLASALNTTMASNEIILPLSTAWQGMAIYQAWADLISPLGSANNELMVKVQTEGRAFVGDTAVEGTNYTMPPQERDGGSALSRVTDAGGGLASVSPTHIFGVSRIPGFAATGMSTDSRTWGRLRFLVGLYMLRPSEGHWEMRGQSLMVHLWPGP